MAVMSGWMIPLLWALVALVALVLGNWPAVDAWLKVNAHLNGWVQAGGVFLALGAAVWGAQAPERHRRQAAKTVLLAHAQNLLVAMQGVVGAINEGNPVTIVQVRPLLEMHLESLGRIDAGGLSRRDNQTAIFFRMQAVKAIEAYKNTDRLMASNPAEISRWLAELSQTLKEVEHALATNMHRVAHLRYLEEVE